MTTELDPTASRGGVLLPTASGAETRHVLGAMLRTRRAPTGLAIVVTAAAAASGLIAPAVLGGMVDTVLGDDAHDTIVLLTGVLVAAAVVSAVLTAWGDLLIARVGESTVAELREDVMDRALDLELGTIERAGRGDLVSRLSEDVRMVGEAVSEVLPTLASAGFTIALTFLGLAALDWRFGLAAAIAIPVQLHTLRWYLRRSGPVYAASRVADGARAQQLLESLGGASTVRALRTQPTHQRLVADRSMSAVSYQLEAIRMSTRFYGRLNIAEVIGMTAVLATGYVLVRNGMATVGAATAAAFYFHRLFDPVNSLLGRFDEAQSAAAAMARLVGVLQLRPAHPVAASDVAPSATNVAWRTDLAPPTVEVTGVSYEYRPGHPVLVDVDLTIAPGERIALVGASGAGKTTLAKLIAGIHPPTTGRVTIDGQPVAELGSAARTIGLVTQEVHVFAGALASDLRLVRPGATDAELRDVLAVVDALDWVDRLPDGLSTVVGAGGQRLSATQSQQLALARIALLDPAMVILDEATAEAGSAGARILEIAAERVLAGHTSVVVAHRLTQARLADQILVIDHGRVVERGSHDELVATEGHYGALWSAWVSGGQSPSIT